MQQMLGLVCHAKRRMNNADPLDSARHGDRRGARRLLHRRSCCGGQLVDGIYVFGDSYSDVGNISIATGGAIPGPLYYNGRFSNGPIWVEHIAGTYADPGALAGWRHRLRRWRGRGHSSRFRGQQPTHSERAPAGGAVPATAQRQSRPESALHLDGWRKRHPECSGGYFFAAARFEIAFGLATSMELLERAGARYLLVPNLFDIGKLPAARLGGISSFATATTLVVNQRLNSWLLLEAFAPQTHLYRSDAYDFLQGVFTDSSHFGFNDVTDPCLVATPTPSVCTNPYVNLFWDVDHLTQFGHSMLATLAVQALHQQ